MCTDGDFGVALILLPLAGAMVCFLWPHRATPLGLVATFVTAVPVGGLGCQLIGDGVYRHAAGGWDAPLGIVLYADGLSLMMLAMTATVGCAVAVYAAAYFERARATRFWPIWLLMLGALNALFLSGDIFNLYVCLELLGLTAVALAALSGEADALSGAMRYLIATLIGSLCYLLGVALLYHGFGTVDIEMLAASVSSGPATWAALGLMVSGLALKSALFPLHFWLPPAHASATTPVSALLSALVVKASFYILLRLWIALFDTFAAGVDALFCVLGAAAVLWGSMQALRQTRLKMLVAYSTVAQVGYLFLAFPLAASVQAAGAITYLAISHALAKAAMFMAAGNLLHFGGHDRIADLDRVVQRLPLTASAFALAGVSLMGLPPSGGFIGKWLLLEAALARGRWDIAAVVIVGGLLTAGYVFKVLGRAFTQAPVTHEPRAVHASLEWSALALALGSIVLGVVPSPLLWLAGIGDAFDLAGVVP